MGIIPWTVLCTFLFVNSAFSSTDHTTFRVIGPDQVFTGNFEKFTCEMDGEEVTEKTGLSWKLKLNNDHVVELNESDTISVLEMRKFVPSKDQNPPSLTLTSFIRVENPEVKSIICENTPKTVASKDLWVIDLPILTADNDPCQKAENSGKPAISMFIPSTDLITPSYSKSHYVGDGDHILLAYGTDITEVKLVCYSPSSEVHPKWSLNQDVASKMKYAAWGEQSSNLQCKRQVLHIYQVAGLAGQVTDIKLDCSAGGSLSKASLGFEFHPGRSGGMDFNSTQNCIDNVIQQFYDKELTGVGVASSFVIVLMMAGIAVLKRQLNQQQNINRDLQGKNPGTNNGNGGTSSTEQLNPNNHNVTNNATAGYP